MIAASNANLLEAVANRSFREDLYYRLNVVALRMPPLRERAFGYPRAGRSFSRQDLPNRSRPRKSSFRREALEMFLKYSWPGNVRQLEHALESAVALSGTR